MTDPSRGNLEQLQREIKNLEISIGRLVMEHAHKTGQLTAMEASIGAEEKAHYESSIRNAIRNENYRIPEGFNLETHAALRFESSLEFSPAQFHVRRILLTGMPSQTAERSKLYDKLTTAIKTASRQFPRIQITSNQPGEKDGQIPFSVTVSGLDIPREAHKLSYAAKCLFRELRDAGVLDPEQVHMAAATGQERSQALLNLGDQIRTPRLLIRDPLAAAFVTATFTGGNVQKPACAESGVWPITQVYLRIPAKDPRVAEQRPAEERILDNALNSLEKKHNGIKIIDRQSLASTATGSIRVEGFEPIEAHAKFPSSLQELFRRLSAEDLIDPAQLKQALPHCTNYHQFNLEHYIPGVTHDVAMH